MDGEERFYSKIKFSGETQCWLWKGTKFSSGYGAFKIKGKTWRAHKFSYILFNGKIPEKLILHHKCKNKLCMNPKHMELVTPKKHTRVSTDHNYNKIHCIRGHLLSGHNLYIQPSSGKRQCRICQHNQQKKFLQKNPHKYSEYANRWRSKNRKKWNEYMKNYYQKRKLSK